VNLHARSQQSTFSRAPKLRGAAQPYWKTRGMRLWKRFTLNHVVGRATDEIDHVGDLDLIKSSGLLAQATCVRYVGMGSVQCRAGTLISHFPTLTVERESLAFHPARQ
jgi:hypothetical protein